MGVAIAALSLGYVPDSALGDLDRYEPYVLVDIGEIIDPGEEVMGEAKDVNDAGYLVGWYEDSGSILPFVLDPTDGGLLMDINFDYTFDSTTYEYDEATMLAINQGTTLGGTYICGWIKDADETSGDYEPAYWEWNSGTEEWDCVLVSPATRVEGVSNDVNIDGDQTGFYKVSGVENVFYFTIASGATGWGAGVGYGINDSNIICGDALELVSPYHEKGFVQWGSNPSTNRQYLDGTSSFDEYGHARAINESGDIVGSAAEQTSTYRAWVWHHDSGYNWDTGEQLTPLPLLYRIAIANDINDADDPEIVGNYEHPLDIDGFYTLEYDDTWKSINLHGNTLFPLTHLELLLEDTPNPKVDRCYGINNNAWVAGSFQPDKDADPESYRPCLMVQNDMDNDSAPDQRELFTAEESDSNTNKLIDWAEDMRSGLFSPGVVSAYPSALNERVYAVRFMGFDQDAIDCIVDSPCDPECSSKSDLVNDWANEGVEVIVNVRTVDPATNRDGKADCLAANTNSTEEDILDNLRTFSYQFARCIDGVQLGNEIFSGPGHYWFYSGDLPGGYTGHIKLIDDDEDLEEALEAIEMQLGVQIEEVRRGSALAGRPLRIFGPAVAAAMTNSGLLGSIPPAENPLDENDYDAMAIDWLIDFVDEQRAIFDQHLNYEKYDDFEDAAEAITGQGNEPWGDGPDQIATLEFGPIVSSTWWDAVGEGRPEAAVPYFETQQGTSPCNPPSDEWQDFVDDWGDDSILNGGFASDFKISEAFGKIIGSTYNFRYACINADQKGLDDGDATKNDLGVLRAQKVWDSCVSDSDNLMDIAIDDYIDAVEDNGLDDVDFDPHPDTADCGCTN